jgi:transcriptional regulator GlxA family with amidase domain
VVALHDAHAFAAIFVALQETWHAPDSPARALRVVALSLQLFSLVLESWQQTGATPRPAALRTPEDRFIEVITYMTDHLAQKLSRECLAARVHLNPGYFDRVFLLTYGVSPMRMLRTLRLRRAQQLLESTNASLETIAAACGLGDAAYLSRVFRQWHGQTPGQYRQSTKSTMSSYVCPLSAGAPLRMLS